MIQNRILSLETILLGEISVGLNIGWHYWIVDRGPCPDLNEYIVVMWENVLVCREYTLRNSGLVGQQVAPYSQIV